MNIGLDTKDTRIIALLQRPEMDQAEYPPLGIRWVPFEIVSVHLLVVLVGAAYLARAKRRKDEAAGS